MHKTYGTVVAQQKVYRSRALLGACAYNSTGRKYAPISKMRLITNDIPRIGSVLQLELLLFPHRRAEFLEEDYRVNSEYLGRELNLRLTVNMRL